ncbi:uncharacterized protein [Spinacia oleracea]|uniref:Uncharacterized protein isoform X2 n=1 Tax=Spinacia oleracea TaxID=3562 RepID=A0A9R0JTA0_SPIOL|nr:uncharacterized protein LOC110786088 isoform X2 [Spinacia oleracea]
MDFQSLKRRDLQSLCKLNNIPANTTNATMADALASLPTVEGLGDFLFHGSPERSVNATPAPRTTATRTQRGTRTKAVEGTDTRKTTATRTIRKRTTQEASVQKKTEKDLQTEFEADMEQSGVTESNVLPGAELEEISEVSVENEQQLLSESQSEPQNEVQQEVKDGQGVIDLDDCTENQEQYEATEMSDDSMKVDFHSLGRKDLQNLCKKNKIPANTSNATMASALESLENVEGLQEFLKECESRAPGSPLMSGITSSRARQSRTTVKITREEPQSCKMITKSCRGSRKRTVDEPKNDVTKTPAAQSAQQKATPAASALSENESIQEKEDNAVQSENSSMDASQVSGGSEFNGDISNCNNGLFSVENLEEATEVLANLVKFDIGSDALADSSTQDEGLKFGSAETESQVAQIEDLISAPDSVVESLPEKLDIIHVEYQVSEEFVSATQADQVSLEISADKAVTFNFDSTAHMSPVEYEGSPAEDEMSEKPDTELTTQADEPSLEINEESDGSCTEEEDEMSENSDSELTIQADKPSLEINVEGDGSCTDEEDEMSECSEDDQLSLETNLDSEGSCTEEEDDVSESSDSELTIQDDQLSVETNVDSESDSATDSSWFEKAAVLFANQFDTESSIQVRSFVATESKTPLNLKSLRKLKRMYKEKLQEKTLAKSMEKLCLDETDEITLASVEEGNDEASASQVMPADEDDVGESEEETDDEAETDDDDNVEQVDVLLEQVQETPVTNSSSDGETEKLFPVQVLVDNEVVPEDAVVGDINVVVACPPQATPIKCSSVTKKPVSVLVTPSKSSCKTPMSAGRKNRVMDVNKENIIDSSISKTEAGKIKLAVAGSGKLFSAMSMGKLMKEVKVLEQSEKKRLALKSRSENQCNLNLP